MTELEALSNRLVELIKESPRPLEEMRVASKILFDFDLSDFQPDSTTSPEEFAQTAIDENPVLLAQWPDRRGTVEDPSEISSVEELIRLLYGSEGGL
ncbi:MAG: hypothetical protein ACOYLQ_10095 [Hyphomicrobiaceae bacterium]|jgi:hypothetical protein